MVNPSDADDSLAGHSSAFAATAARRLPAWAAVVLTGALIVTSGLLFYLGRSDLAAAIASLSVSPPPSAAAPSLAEVALIPAEPAPPEAPKLTALEVEAKLAPLPAELRALIAEGRGELPEFAERGSKDPTEARIMEARWQAWGRTWRNRLRVIYQKLPSRADCERHPTLGASCHEVKVAFGLLESAADQPSIEAAGLCLDDGEAALRVLPLLRVVEPRE